jgi:alpha-beta hydrolase superfamily lysophospholipase
MESVIGIDLRGLGGTGRDTAGAGPRGSAAAWQQAERQQRQTRGTAGIEADRGAAVGAGIRPSATRE